MYLNFKLIRELDLSVSFLPILFAANQNRINDESETLADELFTDDIKTLFEKDLLTTIKAKKKSDKPESLIRLSEQGKKLLEDITTPEISSGDIQMFEYLSQMYLSHDDTERTIGNSKKTKMYCAIMRNRLGMTLHEFFWFCDLFLKEYPFTKVLEYLFFNSNKNRYGKFENNIEDSPIYQFWEQKEQEIRNYWQAKIKTDE